MWQYISTVNVALNLLLYAQTNAQDLAFVQYMYSRIVYIMLAFKTFVNIIMTFVRALSYLI